MSDTVDQTRQAALAAVEAFWKQRLNPAINCFKRAEINILGVDEITDLVIEDLDSLFTAAAAEACEKNQFEFMAYYEQCLSKIRQLPTDPERLVRKLQSPLFQLPLPGEDGSPEKTGWYDWPAYAENEYKVMLRLKQRARVSPAQRTLSSKKWSVRRWLTSTLQRFFRSFGTVKEN